MPSLLADLRYAFRTLRRVPMFTALAVSILAVGIGLSTVLFSMVDAVLLRALPFQDPHRLVEIWGRDRTREGMRVPAQLVEALRVRARTLDAVAVHGPLSAVLWTDDGPVDVRGRRVSANVLDVLGVPPALGRGFLPDEDGSSARAAILVSHGFWRRFLSGDSGVVGRSIRMDSMAYTVVGVMPVSFQTSFRGTDDEFWTTYASQRTRQLEREAGHEVFARLAPRATLEGARREVEAIAATAGLAGWGPSGRQLGMRRQLDYIVGDSARGLKLLFAAVAVILVVVCANLALLLLARSDARLREFATRKAVGAPYSRLFGLALAESLLLALGGAGAGVALAHGLLPVMLRLVPTEIPRIASATVDVRVLVVTVVVSVVAACAFGLAPALRLSRLDVAEAVKGATSPTARPGAPLRSVLVAGQVAASVALCVLAGLVGQTFLTLRPSGTAFALDSLATFPLYLPSEVYPDAVARHRLQIIADEIATVPGISAVAIASNVPFSGDDETSTVRGPAGVERPEIRVERRVVSANYFSTLRLPVVRGRAFASADVSGAPPVAIVNERLAQRLAPAGGDAVGVTIRIGSSPTAALHEVVGVVADARSDGTSTDIHPEVYVSSAQRPPTFAYLVVRSSLDAEQVSRAVRGQLRRVVPELPLGVRHRAVALRDLVGQSLAAPRFLAVLSTAFSASALLLSAVGVFGLVSYAVSQRRREFAVRAALGARPRDLSLMTLKWVAVLAVSGVAGGLAAAAYLTRFVESQLYAVRPRDLPTFALAASIMLVAAAIAAAIPARQAARVDPMRVLRHD